MQNIKIIQDEAIGIINVDESCQYNKVNADKVIIHENITVRMFGVVNKIIVKKGAKLFLHGVIRGNVENKGGEIYVY